jgi:hypothetical protein
MAREYFTFSMTWISLFFLFLFLLFSSFAFPFLLLDNLFGHRRVGNRAHGIKLRGTQQIGQAYKQESQTEQIVRVISIVKPLFLMIEASPPSFL